MSADAWTLSTHEFRLLWEMQADRTPYPRTFAFGGGETFDDADDRRKVEKQIRSELQATTSQMKEAAFASFAAPRFSVDVIGARAHGTRLDHFRAHGAWRGRPEPAFLAVQKSTDDLTIGGDVDITRYDATGWSDAIVGVLPQSPPAGRLPVDNNVPTNSQPVADVVLRSIASSASKTSAAAAFAHLAPSMGAVITLRVGSLADTHSPDSADIHVADIDDDGRYALIMDEPATALGVDADALARLVNKVLNTVRSRHDEKRESA
ncbi:ESX secretion-associated protein EspG [Williamsia sp.]|uniref:ESX secretion-associated protein EspG n=1 Tax=Williamsia sp. TaxID=1872085 RepID=UPI001A2FE593|nr:ESX secretion-associated protein EspG [Williamsia sp.]MBJ7291143.1 ESX secretion-associated protein EspG [Williamsia sp.]